MTALTITEATAQYREVRRATLDRQPGAWEHRSMSNPDRIPEPWEYVVHVHDDHDARYPWERIAYAMTLDLWGALKLAQHWAHHGWTVRVTKAAR